MSEESPSKCLPNQEGSGSKISSVKKAKRFREHGATKNLAAQYKEVDRQNREKIKEFQERYAILKGKLPKVGKHSEEAAQEMTSFSEQSFSIEEEVHTVPTISTNVSDEVDTVSKILRERDECSQKTKAALEVLEEKKHQFIEYQNLVARVQKDFEKPDSVKFENQKATLEQAHRQVDLEKEALQKDIEDKSKVIRALQLKIDRLSQTNEELKISLSSVVPADVIDNSSFVSELELRNEKIKSLEVKTLALLNDKLAYEDKILQKEKEVDSLQVIVQSCVEKISDIGAILQISKHGEIFGIDQLESKICDIEAEISKIQQSNKEVEIKLQPEKESGSSSPSIKDSPIKGTKRSKSQQRGRNNKPKSPWASVSSSKEHTTSLMKDTKSDDSSSVAKISDLEGSISELNEKIKDNQVVIDARNQEIDGINKTLNEKEQQILEITEKYKELCLRLETKTDIFEKDSKLASESVIEQESSSIESSAQEAPQKINLDVLELKLEDAQNQVDVLSKQLDDANKNMIKTKSAHKIKIKQMQKTIDEFSKMSDAGSEVVRLNNEVAVLIQKVAELEEDKGNLQLHLVDYDSVKVSDHEAGQSLMDVQKIADARLQAISELEMQKFDLVQELHAAKQKTSKLEEKVDELLQLENDHVSSQMNSVQLEEQLEKFNIECKSFRDQSCELKSQNECLNDLIKNLNQEKSDLSRKLESYVQENLDLSEKLEKLTEKVSSAESIEIVESLTTQEKLEIERFNEGITQAGTVLPTPSNDYFSSELNEDILKLSQDSVELHNKIELFTQERREVMEKMDILRNDNLALNKNIEELIDIKQQLESELDTLKSETLSLKEAIATLDTENKDIKSETEMVLKEKNYLEQKIADLITKTNIVKSSTMEFPLVEKHTPQVDFGTQVELINSETYDTNAKAIKKLTKEILKLKNTLKEKNAECDVYSQLESQLQFLKEELVNVKKENISVKEEKNALNLHIASLTQSITELSSENQTLIEEKSINVDLKKVSDQLEDQLKIKDICINDLRVSMGNLENEILNLNIALNTEMLNVNNKIEEINEIQSQMVCVKQDIELKDQLVESLQNDVRVIEEGKRTITERLKRNEEEVLSLHRALDENENEMNNLIKERDFNLREINRLQGECDVKDNTLTEINFKYCSQLNEIKQAYESESKTLKDYNVSIIQKHDELFEKCSNLEKQNNDLELKNREFIEKLKKFAFNVKKKHNICIELEEKVQYLTNQLEAQKVDNISSLKAGNDTILEEENANLLTENVSLKLKFEMLNSQISELLMANETLKAQVNDEHLNIERLTVENEVLTSLQRDCEISTNLSKKVEELESNIAGKKIEIEKLLDSISQVQIAYDSFKFGHEAKLQERDLFIESLETDISKYKDRIMRLENIISVMEEKRFSLEHNASQLGNQVQELLENQKSAAEHAQHEDELERRMEALIAHDELVEKKLDDSRTEIEVLQEKIRSLLDISQKQAEELHNVQNLAEKQNKELNKVGELQEENQLLQVELDTIQTELKKNTQKFEKTIKEKKEDFDNLEGELQAEIDSLRIEKKNICEEYEKSLDLISSLKGQLEEIQHHNNWLKTEYDIINSNYSEAKSFQERSDQFEHKYREVSKDVTRLEKLLEEKNKQLISSENFDKPSTLIPDTTDSSAQVYDDKKVSLSDYFSAPSQTSFDILSQIISDEDVEQAKKSVPNIDLCIHSQVCQNVLKKPSIESQSSIENTEIKEDIIIPKKAYPCASKDLEVESAVEIKELGDFEANWGEDAHLEEEHYQHQSLVFQSSDDYKKLSKQVDFLKLENEALIKELSDIKTKLSKSLRKTKDLKSSNDILEAKIQDGKKGKSNDLDLAIQDELLTQVKKLEETVGMLQSQLDKSLGERDCLNKQIDVLTTANERLIEMKEKMDCETATWKQKHKELNNRLSQFESFADMRTFSNVSNIPSTTKTQENESSTEELRSLIKELTADNEELQAMLEEMRQGKIELEKQVARQTVPSYIGESDDIKLLKSENEQRCNDIKLLQNQLLGSDHQIKKFENMYSILKNQFDVSETNRISAETLVKETSEKIESLNCLNVELSTKCDVLCSENRHLLEGLQKIENENRSLFEKLSILQNDYQNLSQEKENVEYSFKYSNSNEVSTLLQEKEFITAELSTLKEQYHGLLNNYDKIEKDHTRLIQSTTDSEKIKQTEIAKLLKQIDDISKELNEANYYKDEYSKLNKKCLLLENNENDLLQKYNNAMENNDKVSKYNLSLQEDYNKLEYELKNSALKIQKLEEYEHLHLKNLDQQEVVNIGSQTPKIEEENTQEDELSQRLYEYEILLHDKENRLKLALISIDDLNTNLYSKEREIEELRNQFSLLEKHLAESIYEKDSEIANIRLEAYNVKSYYVTEIEKLSKEKDNIEKSVEIKLSEIRSVMESQELEIVTLKETVSIFESKSSNPIDMSKETIDSTEVQRTLPNKDNDPNKAELDFALYLLHQRSVKCEELTMELSSLLEERDTLQLRLSDALRLNETLRRRCSPAVETQLDSTGETLTVASSSGTMDDDTSPSEGLRNKLTELKSVKHQRDIRLREEQEQRERELQLMQVDIANLPEEAATKLREAHYTLSRNSQSTSEVFLNWLMGKSTPKVVQNM